MAKKTARAQSQPPLTVEETENGQEDRPGIILYVEQRLPPQLLVEEHGHQADDSFFFTKNSIDQRAHSKRDGQLVRAASLRVHSLPFPPRRSTLPSK